MPPVLMTVEPLRARVSVLVLVVLKHFGTKNPVLVTMEQLSTRLPVLLLVTLEQPMTRARNHAKNGSARARTEESLV